MDIKNSENEMNAKQKRNLFAIIGSLAAIFVIGFVLFFINRNVNNNIEDNDIVNHEFNETDIIDLDDITEQTPLADITGVSLIDTIYLADVQELINKDLSVGYEVITSGYYTPDDGGAASYLIVDAKNLAINNPGTIKLENGNYAVLELDDSMVSLKRFGAIGDGVTDDTEAIKQALSFAKGKTLIVPVGTFLISSAITLPNDIYITGEGEDSVFIAKAGYGVGADFFRTRTAQDITIDNVCFDGNSDNNSREMGHSDKDGIHLMDLWNSSNVCIQNCVFRNNVYCAVRIVGNSNELSFVNNEFNQVDCGIIYLGNGNVDGLTIRENVFDGHANSEPVSLDGKGYVKNVLIENNKMLNKNKGNAIYIGNGGKYENVTISDNYMSQDAVGIACSGVNSLFIYGNTVEDTMSGAGIKLTSCTGAEIYDNYISRSMQYGICINGCTDIEFYNNTISQCGMINKDFYPMDIRGNCTNVNVYSNTFEKTIETATPYSIGCRSTGDVTITDNTFLDTNKIWLTKDSSGVHVFGQDVTTRNDSKTNNVE